MTAGATLWEDGLAKWPESSDPIDGGIHKIYAWPSSGFRGIGGKIGPDTYITCNPESNECSVLKRNQEDLNAEAMQTVDVTEPTNSYTTSRLHACAVATPEGLYVLGGKQEKTGAVTDLYTGR